MDTNSISTNSQQIIDNIIELGSTWGIQVIGALALLIVGRWAAALVRRGVRRAMARGNVDESLIPFFSSATYYIVLVVVGIAVLELFGIETTSFIAVLGAAGLAIGLALQGTLSNFAAGVMLLGFRPFKVGNYVEVAGQAGTVDEIGIFTTKLNTPDNVQIVIPNSAVYGAVIKNYSAHEKRRIDLVMGISYGDDIGKAVDVIEGVLAAEPRVLKDPEPTVAVVELADSSVNLVVRPWVDGTEYWPTRFDLTRALKEGLEAGGCNIPFPQRDLHVIDMPTGAASGQ